MGLSSRLLLLPTDGAPHRLADADFGRLYASTSAWRVPAFSNQHVRWASLVVELFDRRHIRVVHRSFAFLNFDATGRLDVGRLNREQVARFDVAISAVLARETSKTVINASSHFAARGGSWKPDVEVLAMLDAAALGRLPCLRVKLVS